MQTVTLAATTRKAIKNQVKALRRDGRIPGVLYGFGVKAQNVEFDARVLNKLLVTTGESVLLDLVIDDGKPTKVLVQDLQRDPLTDNVTHIDLRAVNMKKKTTTEIPIVFVGESPAVKAHGAILTRGRDNVEVECLPDDLVSEITVNLADLLEIGDLIRVKDIIPPNGITILTEPDAVLVNSAAPITEEELKKLDEAPVEDVGEVEVEEKGKEKAEGEEGEPEAAEKPTEEKKEEKAK